MEPLLPVVAARPPGVLRGTVRAASPEGPLKDVLVRVLDPTPSVPPAVPLVLEERDGRFVPEVGAVVAGQGLVLRSSARAAHTWSAARGAVPLFRLAQPAGAPELARALAPGEGPVRLQCEEHPQAVTHLFVQPNGQFATTDEAGHFEVRGVAAGFHTLEAWRSGWPARRQTVEVPPGGVRELQVQLGR
ncbi:MAG: carboxypeptidase regulatory-like domain-containing protein [Deltaproteobacteria bacterium]|nr:carboxypeptidase regulatory-like domain-containing protein [Deltaproteobacteria bacterium]